MTESNRIEFKRELTRELDIEKEVVAFLNYREGGIIYIGIDDSGKPVGVQDIDGDMLAIKNRLRDNILPSPMGLFDVTVERIEGVPVIRVFVSSGSEKPYYKKQYGLSPNGCFVRIGTAAEPMTQAQIDDLYTHRVHNSLKNVVSPRQDLTFAQLRIYYAEKGMQLNDNFLRSLDLLTDDGKLNYVAYLLADENGNSMKLASYLHEIALYLVEIAAYLHEIGKM
jgi:predicted HTH transcriptional regulator